MRVALAANRRVNLDLIADHLAQTLAAMPLSTTILLRKGKSRPPQAFERRAAELCDSLGINVEWAVPQGSGREASFHRDNALISSADWLIAYMSDESPPDAGTAHVIDAAIREDLPSVAYLTSGEELSWLGGM